MTNTIKSKDYPDLDDKYFFEKKLMWYGYDNTLMTHSNFKKAVRKIIHDNYYEVNETTYGFKIITPEQINTAFKNVNTKTKPGDYRYIKIKDRIRNI